MKNIINRALAAEKKLFTLLLTVAASIGTMFAESGTCGDNLTWDLTSGVLTISGTATGIDQITNDQSPFTNKLFRGGQLFILRDGKKYNAQGARVK